jgi:hypothetical protein
VVVVPAAGFFKATVLGLLSRRTVKGPMRHNLSAALMIDALMMAL